MGLIKVKNNIATREPVPAFLVGLAPESLIDLSWADPALGLAGSGWWPSQDQSAQLATNEHYGAEILSPDAANHVVVITRAILQYTQAELDAQAAARDCRVTKLAFRARFTEAEKVAMELAAIDDPAAVASSRQLSATLRVRLADVNSASFIDLKRPDTRSGVQALESLGILAAGRALEILDAQIQPMERPAQ